MEDRTADSGATRRDFTSLEDRDLVNFALQHPSASSLQNGDRYLYTELKRRNLYESRVRPHLVAAPGANPYTDATDESLLKTARRYSGRVDLRKNNHNLFEEISRRDLLDGALPKRQRKWDRESLEKTAKGFHTRREFAEANSAAYNTALKLGLLAKLFPDERQEIEARARKWSEAAIQDAALQCRTRTEFHSRFPGAYAAARSLDLLEQVCAHMPLHARSRSPAGMTNLELEQAASLYRSPSEFQRGNTSAYNQAVKRKVFAEIARRLGWKA